MSTTKTTQAVASVHPVDCITYTTVHNALAESLGKAKQNTASVIHARSWDKDGLATELAKRNTGLSTGQTLAVLIELETLGNDLMARGDIMNLGFVRLSTAITGLVGDDGKLDAGNEIVVRATSSQTFKAAAAGSGAINIGPSAYPQIAELVDLATGQANAMTAGGQVRIVGKNLQIDTTAADEGITILDADALEHRVTSYTYRSSTEVIFACPSGFDGPATVTLACRNGEPQAWLPEPRSITVGDIAIL